MANLNIALPDDLAHAVQDAIDNGEYAGVNDVIRDALTSWMEDRVPLLRDTERLRQLWDEGIASGPGQYSTAEDIIAEARRRQKS